MDERKFRNMVLTASTVRELDSVWVEYFMAASPRPSLTVDDTRDWVNRRNHLADRLLFGYLDWSRIYPNFGGMDTALSWARDPRVVVQFYVARSNMIPFRNPWDPSARQLVEEFGELHVSQLFHEMYLAGLIRGNAQGKCWLGIPNLARTYHAICWWDKNREDPGLTYPYLPEQIRNAYAVDLLETKSLENYRIERAAMLDAANWPHEGLRMLCAMSRLQYQGLDRRWG